MVFTKFLNLRTRKAIQYFLFLCILLIQVFIALFFYSEYQNRKNTSFLEKQLMDVGGLEKFTNNSKDNFNSANIQFQNYIKTKDSKYLDEYYNSISKLTSSLDDLDSIVNKADNLKSIFAKSGKNYPDTKEVKSYVDSVLQEVKVPVIRDNNYSAQIKKYKVEYPTVKEVDVQTEVFKDTVQKKKLFGRLKDAIAGKENVRKDSTVVTLKEIIAENHAKSRRMMDSLLNSAHNYYVKQIRTVEVKQIRRNSDSDSKEMNQLVQLHDLLNYSSNLMSFYDGNIKSAKTNLEAELEKQRSKSENQRFNFAIAAMILMFLVSILMLYFTRLAFFYEEKLQIADRLNKENINFKNRILGMLSHELRSPLKIIGLFINRIQKKTTDESIKEQLKSISFTSNTLLLQSNQILEYTKNQQLQNQLIIGTFNLKNEVDSVLAAMEPYIETRNNKYTTTVDIDPTLEVNSDKARINQLFINIIGNANKFTENGMITVNSKAEYKDDFVVLNTAITDTGAGISQEDLKSIFEPYYQGVLSNDIENLGAGLGLSLCKEIVALFEGEISAESTIGKGTTVSFSLHLNRI